MDLNKHLRFLAEIKETLKIKKNISIIKQVINEDSFYHDLPRKSKAKRIIENIRWYLKNGEPCRYYNSYGFDIVGLRKQKEYLPYKKFRIERDNENFYIRPFHVFENYTCVLRDKILFSAFFGKYLGETKIPKDYGLIKKDGCIYSFITNCETDFEDLLTNYANELFVKKINGECGEGCYLFKKETFEAKKLQELKGSEYIIQENIKQHEILNTINNSCVNTIRIITRIGKKTGKPVIFAHFLRCGINSINDNRATGGLAIKIDDEGFLRGLGIGHHSSVDKHPVSNIVFDGYKLPYWDEVKQLVIDAHSLLPQIGSIGWDVAITSNGPILLEGNDNWEICGPQDTCGGLKEKWYSLKNS